MKLYVSALAVVLSLSVAQAQQAQVNVSTIGNRFVEDHSIPSLGLAFKSPSGLIWGSTLMRQGKPVEVHQRAAINYCKRIGARLPSQSDYETLARQLVKDPNAMTFEEMNANYNVIPGLGDYHYWTSTPAAIYYGSEYGTEIIPSDYGIDDWGTGTWKVRCVSP